MIWRRGRFAPTGLSDCGPPSDPSKVTTHPAMPARTPSGSYSVAEVDGEVPANERRGPGPDAERPLDPCHELGRGERLDDVVGRAAPKRPGDRHGRSRR